MDYILTQDGELYHYGVKGMKWGVIRYRQNRANRGIAKRERQNAKLEKKAAKLERKALKVDPDSRKHLAIKRKAAKARLKSVRSMTISELSTKKDYKYQINAAKARYKIENNNLKIDSLNTRSVELGRQLLEADDND